MSFRRNYLPRQSQSWAREVQSRIQGLEQDLTRDSINNRTRDDQLQASYNRLDLAFIDLRIQQESLQALIDNIYVPETQELNGVKLSNGTVGADKIVANSITANEIAAGTITASEIDADYIYAGDISADQINAGTLSADYISGGTIDASDITVTNLDASNITSGSLTADRISGGTITASDISGVNISGVSISASDFTSGGIVDVAEIDCGIIQVDQDLQALRNSFVANNTTTSFNGNLFINSSGTMFRNPTISSFEAKENIQEFTFNTDAFMSVNPVTFNYKREAVRTDEEAQTTSLGFILEDFENIGLSEFLTIPTNEIDQYKGLRYDKLYMFLHKSVQELNERVKALENG